MIPIIVVAALALLALITQAGVVAVQRLYPAQGQSIEVDGATLNVLDLGPRDGAGPPIVMIHGASSNLEVMRQSLGEVLAKTHRVILIDRPGHGWSTRARLEDSTPAIQGLDRAGADKTRRRPCHPRGPFLGWRARRADGARLSGARGGPGDAGAGRLSLAGRGRLVQQARHHARDRPAARLYDHAAAWLLPGRARPAPRVPAAVHAGKLCPRDPDAINAAAARIPRQCLRPRHTESSRGRAGAALCRDCGADRDHHRRARQDGVDQPPFTAVRARGAADKIDRIE